MREPDAETRGPIAFAERVLGLLDEARYTATYKYAVLLGLVDLCLEGASETGEPPAILTTRQLAERVVEIYWPHTMPFVQAGSASVFRQNVRGQAEILSDIAAFRSRHAPDPSAPRWPVTPDSNGGARETTRSRHGTGGSSARCLR